MKYCPVLLEVKAMMEPFYKAKYLLQVWDKEGVKVYEKKLNSKISSFVSPLLNRSNHHMEHLL